MLLEGLLLPEYVFITIHIPFKNMSRQGTCERNYSFQNITYMDGNLFILYLFSRRIINVEEQMVCTIITINLTLPTFHQ